MRKILLLAFAAGSVLMFCSCSSTGDRQTAALPVFIRSTNSIGNMFGILPSAVQRTIRAQAGASEIASVQKVAGASEELFEIRFRETQLYPTLFVDVNGNMVTKTYAQYTEDKKPEVPVAIGAPSVDTGVSTQPSPETPVFPSVPPAVSQTIQEMSPNGVIISATRSPNTIYEVIVREEGRNFTHFVTADGQLLPDIQ